MSRNNFNWVTSNTEDGAVCCDGGNDRFIGCVEYIGEDLHKNQMWSASLFDKETRRPVPVSEYGLPFNSMESAKEAILRAIDKEGSR